VRILITIFIFALLCPYQAWAACLAYDPVSENVSGKLVRKTFPGLPNYESVRNGDSPETGFYLLLVTPICTVGDPKDGTAYPQQNVKSVQLVLDQAGYNNLRKYLGKSITINGKLFAAFTGHHHAKVLIDHITVVSRNGL
jgi:hypothetical protein